MIEDTVSNPSEPVDIAPVRRERSVFFHAKIIALFTLLSRVLGLAREAVAGHYLGTGVIASAFTVAFTIPNLFRKLLGEGALSQAFIPLYAQAIQNGKTESGLSAQSFATASVRLLTMILIGITIIGETILGLLMLLWQDATRHDRVLMLQFAAVMMPYVLLVCGGAFLSAILQCHKKFAAPAFAPVLLNVCHIAVVLGGAWFLGLHGRDPLTPHVEALQTRLAFALAGTVLFAGALQVAILLPALRQIGFTFRSTLPNWTPDTRQMLRMSVPVAMGAAVLQISVLLDKTISYFLMSGHDLNGNLLSHFHIFGLTFSYPMEMGATVRLDRAQLMYQFPLGVFAIAIATAIFPSLSMGAVDKDQEKFKKTLRQGIRATLWEGIPASVGLALVADAAVRLLFQHGQTTANDALLITQSTVMYAGGIWAYSLLQVINRAYYALRDTRTPLIASILNIIVNLVVELPLVWVMGESGMAVGTLVSFSIQAIVMLYLLDRRVKGLGLRELGRPVVNILIATCAMTMVCLYIKHSSFYPTGTGQWVWLRQMTIICLTGAGVYIGIGQILGLDPRKQIRG